MYTPMKARPQSTPEALSCSLLPTQLQVTTSLHSVITYSFTFTRVLCQWSHTVCTLFLYGFSHSAKTILRVFHIARIKSLFYFIAEWCSIVWIHRNLSSLHLLMGFGVISSLRLVQIKLLWTLQEHMLSFLLDKSPRVQWLAHTVS